MTGPVESEGTRGRRGGARPAPFAPLDSKLRPPRPHVALVERRRVVRTLLETASPLVVLSAPAGSGKTVTLEQLTAGRHSDGPPVTPPPRPGAAPAIATRISRG